MTTIYSGLGSSVTKMYVVFLFSVWCSVFDFHTGVGVASIDESVVMVLRWKIPLNFHLRPVK
jgi:hypothetical protein